MSLGLEECAVLEMKRGRKHMGGVEEGYRYLLFLNIFIVDKIQLVVYYQYCVRIG